MTSTVLKRRFENKLTKVSNYKQAAQLAGGQLESKIGHGFPGTEEILSPVNTGKMLRWVPRTSTVGKSTGLPYWLLISIGPTNQPLKLILEKQVSVS